MAQHYHNQPVEHVSWPLGELCVSFTPWLKSEIAVGWPNALKLQCKRCGRKMWVVDHRMACHGQYSRAFMTITQRIIFLWKTLRHSPMSLNSYGQYRSCKKYRIMMAVENKIVTHALGQFRYSLPVHWPRRMCGFRDRTIAIADSVHKTSQEYGTWNEGMRLVERWRWRRRQQQQQQQRWSRKREMDLK